MKTKTVRLVVGCLVIVAMLLVSCTTTVTQEQDEAVPTIEEEVITEAEEITIPFTTVEVIKNVEYGSV